MATVGSPVEADQRIVRCDIGAGRIRLPRLAADERRVDRHPGCPDPHAQQRDVDDPGIARPLAFEQGCGYPAGDRHPTDRIAVGRAWLRHHAVHVTRRGSERSPGTAPESGHVISARARIVAEWSVRASARVDDVGVDGAQVIDVDAQFLAGVRQEVGQEHIARARDVHQQLVPVGGRHVQRH